jgi:hypothetical protein
VVSCHFIFLTVENHTITVDKRAEGVPDNRNMERRQARRSTFQGVLIMEAYRFYFLSIDNEFAATSQDIEHTDDMDAEQTGQRLLAGQ